MSARRSLHALLIAAMAAASLWAAAPAAATPVVVRAGTTLTGWRVVNADGGHGDPAGTALLAVTLEGDRLCYRLALHNVSQPLTGATIALQPRGRPLGGVVLSIAPVVPPAGEERCLLLPQDVGAVVSGGVERVAVQLSNARYPRGALRGNLGLDADEGRRLAGPLIDGYSAGWGSVTLTVSPTRLCWEAAGLGLHGTMTALRIRANAADGGPAPLLVDAGPRPDGGVAGCRPTPAGAHAMAGSGPRPFAVEVLRTSGEVLRSRPYAGV